MTPVEYEFGVAEYFQNRGYAVSLTPLTNDYGVDIFATRDNERLAVQAKMYGTSRKINRSAIMELYGAKDFSDCTKALIVTDSKLMPDAVKVAAKLGIEILNLMPTQLSLRSNVTIEVPRGRELFSELWEQQIVPLKGCELTNSRGGKNVITDVDWTGVKRVTSKGKRGHIPIEIFQEVFALVLEHGSITRGEINERYRKRASSGVFLVFSQAPFFEAKANPLSLHIRVDPGARTLRTNS